MENKKWKLVLVIMLATVIGVCCYLGYYVYTLKTNISSYDCNSDEKEKPKYTKYNYDDLEGVYSFTKDIELSDDYKGSLSATLVLLKDGTFKYEQSAEAPLGQLGNYMIDGNKIILNYLFKTNSGAGLMIETGTKELDILDLNSIDDSSVTWGKVKTSGTLKRTNDTIESLFKGIDYYLKTEGLETFE